MDALYTRKGDAFEPTELPLAPLTVETEVVRDGRRARRMRADLKAGDEPVSQLQRTMAAAHFGNGISSACAGIGLADAALHDTHGPFGRAMQSLYVAARP